MALACNIKPLSAFLSTNLNNKIKTYDNLGDRIKRSLGYPLISLEIHTDQLRQNIQLAVEYYTKYAGYTREFLIFDSNMYEQNRGIRLDFLYTLADLSRLKKQWNTAIDYYIQIYKVNSAIHLPETITSIKDLYYFHKNTNSGNYITQKK